jgi:pyruvate formate lyase activating enzyme
LYDFKCFDRETHKQYTGVGNELILENLARLLQSGKSVWIRIPIIPEVNDTVEEMQKIKAFLDLHGTPEKIELLPYHAMGEHKYAAMGKKAHLFRVPADGLMTSLQSVFESE